MHPNNIRDGTFGGGCFSDTDSVSFCGPSGSQAVGAERLTHMFSSNQSPNRPFVHAKLLPQSRDTTSE